MSKVNDILRTGVLLDIASNTLDHHLTIKSQKKEVFKQKEKYQLYEINKKMKKDLFKIYKKDYKKTMSQKHKWVFIFYLTSIILPIIIFLSSLAIFIFFDDIVFACIGLVLGLMFCYIPYFTYKISLNSQAYDSFYYSNNEKILLTENGFNYYYYDIRYDYTEEVAMFKFEIDYKKIKYVEYDKRVDELFVYGNIGIYEYKDNEWQLIKFADEKDNSTPTGVLIQNVYDINLIDLIKNNNVTVKEYNYLDRREKEKLAEKVGI